MSVAGERRSAARGRYAPSPTGELHVGNAATALVAWLSVRARGGRFVMRVEDLDPQRSRPELVERILHDLRWLGLDWDEGPDVGGRHEPYAQSRRFALYDAAFERLREAGRVYPCFCSRREIRTAASAPQEAHDEQRYPGSCRELGPHDAARRVGAGERHAWRLRVDSREAPAFVDAIHGPQGGRGSEPPGDFVVRRSDGVAAYQLAVVVDDAAMAIDEVVRGDDLLPSTARQILLCRALGLPEPRWAHTPLLLGPDGARLSKRHGGFTVRELREAGHEPERLVGRLAGWLGLRPAGDPVAARDLLPGFGLERVRAIPGGIRLAAG